MNKVVNRRDIGSANPVAKFFKGLGDSIKGIITGILFVIISFVLVYNMSSMKENSKDLEGLETLTPQEAEGMSGLVQIQGEPTYTLTVNEPRSGEDVLYYTYSKEEYAIREKRSTRVVEENGRQIEEEIVSYEPEWRSVSGASETKWSEFTLGNIEVDPGNAKIKFNTETLYENEEPLEYDTSLSDERLVDVPQKFRERVVGVTVDTTLVVAGNISNDKISSGTDGTFFVSNMSPDELLQEVKSDEKTKFWLMAFGAWFLMTTGFSMVVGPITHIIDIIPGVGELTKGLLGIIFGVASAIIIFFAYIGFEFWWVFVLALVGFLGFRTFKKMKDPKAVKTETKAEEKKEEKKEDEDKSEKSE